MKHLIEHDNKEIDNDYIKSLLKKSLKKKADEIVDSITGSNISSNQSFKLNLCYTHIDELDAHIYKIESELINRSLKFNYYVEQAMEIPGIQRIYAI